MSWDIVYRQIVTDAPRNPSAGSLALAQNAPTVAVNSPGSILTVGPGKTYATWQDAVNAANAGNIVEGYNGNFAGAETVRAGTSVAPIIFRAAAGQAPVLNSATNLHSYKWFFYAGHSYIEVGDGMTFQGSNDGSTASWQASGDTRGIIVNAANITIKNAKFRGQSQEWILVPTLTTTPGQVDRLRVTGCDFRVSGTLNVDGTPNGLDASDSFSAFCPAAVVTNSLLEDCYHALGGHGAGLWKGSNFVQRNNAYNNDWSGIFGTDATGTKYGQKCFINRCSNSLVESNVFMNPGRQFDNPSTLTYNVTGNNQSIRRNFLLGNDSSASHPGLYGFSIGTVDTQDTDHIYIFHNVIHKMTSLAIEVFANAANNPLFGPVKFFNNIIADCGQAALATNQLGTVGLTIYLRYDSVKHGVWTDLFFFESNSFDTDCNVRILDVTGNIATVNGTLSALQAAYPSNFKNNKIAVNPNFVSTTQSTSTVPATILSETQARWTPQNAALLGTAAPLTRTVGAVSNSLTVTLADAGFFRNNFGWSHLSADTILFEGVGSRTISSISGNVVTLTTRITVADDVGVHLGSASSPNIGAVLGGSPVADLYRYVNFETGALPTNAAKSVNPSAADGIGAVMSVQSAVKHRGRYASKIRLDSTQSPGPYRAEYTLSSGLNDVERQYSRNMWYGISILWPSAFYSIPDPIWETNIQWHYIQQASGDTWSGEPLLWTMTNNVITQRAMYNYVSGTGHPVLNTGTDRGSLDVTVGTLGVDLAFDTWHRFVWHVVWDPRPSGSGGLGYLEMWRNGVKFMGPGTAINSGGFIRMGIWEGLGFSGGTISPAGQPYPKLGIYKGWPNSNDPHTPTPGILQREIYHDDWLEYSAADTGDYYLKVA